MIRTLDNLVKILQDERKSAYRGGMYGIDACKESIKFQMKLFHKNLDQMYIELIGRGLTERLFNTYMIVACEELMEEEKRI